MTALQYAAGRIADLEAQLDRVREERDEALSAFAKCAEDFRRSVEFQSLAVVRARDFVVPA